MVHLDEAANVYISEELAGYAQKLKNDGIVPRQIDLLLLGFAYSVEEGLRPLDKMTRKDMARAIIIDKDARLAVEATAIWYAKQIGMPAPDDDKKLLDFVCRLGSVGVQQLQKEWEGKSKSQIALSVLRLASMGQNSQFPER
jgi:hypothetical protein